MAPPSARFRQDLVASATEAEGVACVDVADAQTGNSFRFYEFEYQLALQLNGQPLEEIVVWASATYGLELTVEGIAEFSGRLAELGFLEAGTAEAAPAPGTPGAAPADALESAEAEWMALQSAQTATFVPDPAMLNGSADLTPVVTGKVQAQMAGELGGAGDTSKYGGGGGGSTATSGTTPPPIVAAPTLFGFAAASPAPSPESVRSVPREPSGITELPADALTEVADSGPVAAGRTDKQPAWEPSGTLKGVATFDKGAARNNGHKVAPSASTTPPRGIAERRQPPAPDAVVMTPFQDEGSRQFRAPPPERAARSRRILILSIVAVVAAAGAGGYYYWSQQHPREVRALGVHVVAPKPTAVYRWFATSGAVVDLGVRPLSFEVGGKVAELLPTGTNFAAGDILGKLSGAAALETELARHKSRLAFYEQVRDSMKASGNQPELRQAELKLAEKQKLIDDTQASLNKLLLRAPEPGEITETAVKVGAQVAPKATVLKWKGPMLHGDFTLDEEDFATAGKLSFCRVEVGGAAGTPDAAVAAGGGTAAAGPARYLDCKLPPVASIASSTGRSGSPLHKFVVGLPGDAGLVAGQPLRLARLRHDAVFPLPPAAIIHGEVGDKVWIATAAGTAELRPVTIVESREEVLVSEGLNVGDEVITDAPPDLQAGTRVAAIR